MRLILQHLQNYFCLTCHSIILKYIKNISNKLAINGKLKAKIQIAEITGKTGTEGSVGILTIPRSSYPNTVAIIPLGYATNSSIQVGAIKITDTDFLFAVQDSITNAWMDSKTVTFMGALIE